MFHTFSAKLSPNKLLPEIISCSSPGCCVLLPIGRPDVMWPEVANEWQLADFFRNAAFKCSWSGCISDRWHYLVWPVVFRSPGRTGGLVAPLGDVSSCSVLLLDPRCQSKMNCDFLYVIFHVRPRKGIPPPVSHIFSQVSFLLPYWKSFFHLNRGSENRMLFTEHI